MKAPMQIFLAVSVVGLSGWLSLSAAPAVKVGTPLPPQIREIVAKRCLECHAKSAFFKSTEAMKASEVAQKIKAGKMPPKKAQQSQGFEGIERSTMLDFLAEDKPAK